MLHKGSFNRIFYNGFQIRAVKAIGLFGKDCRIDTGRPFVALFQVYFQNLLPLCDIWQINEEQFIKAAFAQKLRRKVGHIVGCCYNKNGAFLFLHPCKELPEQAGRDLVAVVGTGTRKRFFNFIDPQHTRADGFCQGQCLPHIAFRLAYILAQQAAHIQPHQRQVEKACRRFSGQAFAAAGHTDDKDAFGNIDMEFQRALHVGKDNGLLLEPLFQHFQTTNIPQCLGKVYQFQHTAFLNKLAFFTQDQLFVFTANGAAVLVCQIQNLLDLKFVQPLERQRNIIHYI